MTNRRAITALIMAGALWGLTVALSKLALRWLDPSWLAALRFLVATPLLAVFARPHLRAAMTPLVVATGTIGFGVVMLLQNAGIDRTSVSHAAIIVGAVPVIVALLSAGLGNGCPTPTGWAGYGLALVGIVLVAQSGGGGASAGGDLLVFASVALSAVFIALQPIALRGRDAAAVTTVQFCAGGLVATTFSLVHSGLPSAPARVTPVAAFAALVLVGTSLPFWLFAYGQAHVPADVAGAFVNLEPLVGAAVGWLAFGNPLGPWQLIGAAVAVSGLLLSALPRPVLVDSTEPRWA